MVNFAEFLKQTSYEQWFYLVVIFSFILRLLCLHPYVFEGPSFYDEAHWVINARAFALGLGFTDLAIPGNPQESIIQYSPGLPIVISILFHLLGSESILLIKTIPILSSIGLIIITFYATKLLFGKRIGLISAIFVSFQHQLFVFSHIIQPEIILSFLMFLLIYITFLWTETKKTKFLLIALPISLTLIIVRVVGFLIVPALLIYILLKGVNWKERVLLNVFLHIGVLSFFALLAYEYFLTGTLTMSYQQELFYYNPHDWRGSTVSATDIDYITTRISTGIIFYLLETPSILLFEIIPQLSIRLILGFFFLGLGIFLGLKKRRIEVVVILLFVALNMVFYSWWFWKQIRYILPISPVLLPFCAVSYAKIADWANDLLRVKKPHFIKFNKKNMALIISTIIILGFIMPDAIRSVLHVEKDRTHPLSLVQEETINAYQWIRDNTPPDAIIMSRNPHRAFYLCERKGVFLQFALEEKDQKEFMRDWDVSYVILEDIDEVRDTYDWLLDPYNAPKEFQLQYYVEVPIEAQEPFFIIIYSFK
jgi:hypothetical protein